MPTPGNYRLPGKNVLLTKVAPFRQASPVTLNKN
jgi:hypothetical protein